MKYKLIKQKALFQIFLMISLIFYTSFSFAGISSNEDEFNYFDLVTQDLFPDVDAQSKVCCELTKQDSIYQGSSCVYTEATNCAQNSQQLAISCLQTDYCAPGVCKLAGACADNVEFGKCKEKGGLWSKGTSAQDPQCKVGCCDLPSGASITTQAQCLDKIKTFPDVRDVNDIFKPDITDQTQCLQQSRSNEEGCCVISNENLCTFVTAESCRDSSGEFQGKGILCSKPGLNCQVTPKQGTICYQNKVYWADSAGNRENVYDGNFNPTWEYTNWLQVTDIGQVDQLAKRNPKELADVAVSGNCQFSLGTTCNDITNEVKNYLGTSKNLQTNDLNKIKNQCINLDCKLDDGKTLRNGESFCLYDSQPGQGRDLVGSGHSVQKCDNGVLKLESCDDRRKTICVQNEVPRNLIDPNDLNKNPSTFASCIPNNWQLCLAANADNENCGVGNPGEEYNQIYSNSDGPCKDLNNDQSQYDSCVKKTICRKKTCENEAVGYCNFNTPTGLCAPSVPPGTLGLEEEFEELSDGNKIGFSFSPVMFFAESNSLGGNPEFSEDCRAGCDINTVAFADRWNNYCTSLGDLGAKYNVVGYYDKLGLFHNGPVKNDNVDDAGSSARAQGVSGENQAYYNSLIRNKNVVLRGENNFFSLLSTIDTLRTIHFENTNNKEFLPGFFENVWNWVSTVGGISTGILIANAFGAGIIIAGTGGSILFAISSKLPLIASLGPAAGPIIVVVLAVIIIYSLLTWLFGPEAGNLTYELSCRPWVAKDKGEQCSLCNDESKFQECNEYVCKSLGKACKLLNEGNPGLETCYWNREGETTPPFIAPADIINQNAIEKVPESTGISGGYKFKNSFTAYTDVEVGVKIVRRDNPSAKEYAECKISRFNDFDYEQSQNFFEDNLVRHEHTREIEFISSPISPEEDRIELEPGKTNTFYIKCKSVNGVINTKPYFIEIPVQQGPDTAPPEIKSFSIKNNAFMPYNLDKTPFTMYVEDKSGIASCKYSTVKGQNYEIMPSNMGCVKDNRPGFVNQYICSTVLTLRPNQENIFYFKCRDRATPQPNTNPVDFPPIEGDSTDGFHLFGSQLLDITQVGPAGEILTTNVKLTVTTEAGAESGKATCYYAGGRKDLVGSLGDLTFSPSGIKFTTTDAKNHETELPLENEKDYVYYLWCRDIAGNEDSAKVEFHTTTPDLSITNIIPDNLKIYSDKVELKIITTGGVQDNGNSECSYKSSGALYGGSGNVNDLKEKAQLQTTHYKNITLSDGSYELTVTCSDSYKIAEKKISFEVDVGGKPKIIRVYKQSNLLNILTDRRAECHFSDKESKFEFSQGTQMVTTNNLLHGLQLTGSKLYYIKCLDLNTNQIGPDTSNSYTVYP